MTRGAYLMNLGLVPYGEAFELQRSLAGAVSQGAIPETVVFLEHPPVVTIGRRTETRERAPHPGRTRAVEIAETDRGGKSTFHGPGQLVCYPILDLGNHGKDVKRYVRDLEEALIRTLAAFELEGVRYEGLTGVWMPPAAGQGPRKIASIGVHVSRWVTTHGYALNVDLDPAPFTEWITACGLEDAAVHDDGARARSIRRPSRTSARRRSRRSRRSSASSSRSCPPTTAPGSGASRSTPRSPLGDCRHPPVPRPAGIRSQTASGIVGRVLVAKTSSSSWRSSASPSRRAITEHAGEHDAIVVCIEGEGFTSVAGETVPLHEGQQVRWPKGISHGLWTEGSTMTTLMIEHFD